MKNAVLVDGVRTPFLRAGTIPNLTATELGSVPIHALLQRYPDAPKVIDFVIGANVGNQILHPDGSNIARILAMACGLPRHIGAWTVNVNCATGLHAVIDAAKTIAVGSAKCVLVAAVEVMSDYPAVYSRRQRAEFYRMQTMLAARKKQKGTGKLGTTAALGARATSMRFMPHKPLWLIDLGLVDPMTNLRMDQSADLIAKEWDVSRKEQDLFALESQRRASAAQASGRMTHEIIPYGKFSNDNGVRHDQTLAQLAHIRPRYSGGTVTPGNSSQITDGAAALLVAEEDFAKVQGWPVLAKLHADWWTLMGCDPRYFGYAPAIAIKTLMDARGMRLSDLDLIETNEAFAAVVLAQARALTSPRYCDLLGMGKPLGDSFYFERTNVNGGAIALGHPISVSGARLLLTCAKELKIRQKELGLVTLCIGGGQGEAMIIERGG